MGFACESEAAALAFTLAGVFARAATTSQYHFFNLTSSRFHHRTLPHHHHHHNTTMAALPLVEIWTDASVKGPRSGGFAYMWSVNGGQRRGEWTADRTPDQEPTLAELRAIRAALEFVGQTWTEMEVKPDGWRVWLMSDSRDGLDEIDLAQGGGVPNRERGWNGVERLLPEHRGVVGDIVALLDDFGSKANIRVKLEWQPRNSSPGLTEADDWAGHASSLALKMPRNQGGWTHLKRWV